MTIRYRYVDVVTEDGVILDLLTFRELKKTPAGAWVQGFYGGHDIGRKRFVLDGTGRRHCHQSKELAWESYKHRKRYRCNVTPLPRRTVQVVAIDGRTRTRQQLVNAFLKGLATKEAA